MVVEHRNRGLFDAAAHLCAAIDLEIAYLEPDLTESP
jgi:hypothetical protein